jgi:dTDP-4-dehydrorhamnose 3,5-epimerase
MQVTATALDGVLILEPRVFGDARGFFMESWNARTFREATGCADAFVQDNHSRSTRGVLRGLHYQLPPMAQGKLVRVVAGEIFDVAVDLRRGSRTFGRWESVMLSAQNQRQLWVPAGFAHGFMVTSDVAEVLYKTTDYYAPQLERCIRWDDPRLAIAWPDVGVAPQLSDKDARAASFVDVELPR